jgi:hypothetical protein
MISIKARSLRSCDCVRPAMFYFSLLNSVFLVQPAHELLMISHELFMAFPTFTSHTLHDVNERD